MIEFDQTPGHMVDQFNLSQNRSDDLGPIGGDTEYLTIKGEPAIELVCETEPQTRFPTLNSRSTFPILDHGLERSFPTLPSPGPLSPQVMLDSRSRFACLSKVTFPMKLWELLEEGETSLVRWTENGLALVLESVGFDEEIQDYFPGEFGDNKLRNFCRQLRVYDFNEVTIKDPNWPMFSPVLNSGSHLRIFYHHFFRRGHPEDLLQIVRVRDIVPRGRSRPKHPRPRQVLPAPTGPYQLGFTPPKAKQRQYEPSPKKLCEGLGINASTVASHLGSGHPLVTTLMQQIGQPSVNSSTFVATATSPHAIWPVGVSENPIDVEETLTESVLLTPTPPARMMAEHPDQQILQLSPQNPAIDTSDIMTSDSSRDSSDYESGGSRSSREQRQMRGKELKTVDAMHGTPTATTSNEVMNITD